MYKKLTTKHMSDTVLHACRETGSWAWWMQEIAEIKERVKVFEAVVWFPHLQKIVNTITNRGLSGSCRNVKMMIWSCAGRCLIQLEGDASKLTPVQGVPSEQARLTLITADDEEPWTREMSSVAPNMVPMGIQGIDATPLAAILLLYNVTRYWQEIKLEADDTVTIDV